MQLVAARVPAAEHYKITCTCWLQSTFDWVLKDPQGDLARAGYVVTLNIGRTAASQRCATYVDTQVLGDRAALSPQLLAVIEVSAMPMQAT